jgi:long-chain acyl-CoA synthetase
MERESLYELTNWKLFQTAVDHHGHREALCGKYHGQERSLTYAEWYKTSLHLAVRLKAAGLTAGDRVLIVSANVVEWYVLDMALSRLGIVNVSLFPNYAPEDYRYILEDARPAALFVGDGLLHNLLKPALSDASSAILRFSMRPVAGFTDWTSLMDAQVAHISLPEPPEPEALYSLFYTSGTGGNPKGVLTLYRGIASAAVSMGRALDLVPEDRAVSFLSVSHAYERGHYLAYVAAGCCLCLADLGSSPAANISGYRATVMTSVPLLLQRMVDGLLVGMTDDTSREAADHAFAYDPGDDLRSPSPAYPEHYSAWKQQLGPHLRVLSCAGAPLHPRISRFFWAIGIPLQEVYGLSECFSVTYARPQAGIWLGTVGPVAEFAEVKLAEDGEVLFRGPFLMAGFHNLPELTARVIDAEGWFHTGDLGTWVEDRFLRLIGRKKDQVKIASGHYIHPGTIEARLMESSRIDQALVFERDGHLEAVLQPAEAFLSAQALRRGLDDKAILSYLDQEVDRLYNGAVLEAERIERLHLARKEWGVLSGELTPSMKVKRQAVLQSIQA